MAVLWKCRSGILALVLIATDTSWAQEPAALDQKCGSFANVKDFANAMQVSACRAREGDEVAQHFIGLMLAREGDGQDLALAVKWFQLAADQGYAPAQASLGDAYSNGQGVDENDAEAVKWYRLAAGQGHASAQFNLGFMYLNGEGVAENAAEAATWYRLAAEQGHASAQFNLGLMYEKGTGLPENDAEAVKWFRLAAEQGLAAGQLGLGLQYALGEGVPENSVEAFKWFNLAAAQGNKIAAEGKESIRKTMTPGQIAEAQRLSAEWKPKQ
jgi:TPR repeat protein